MLTVQPGLVLLTQQPLFSEDADNKTRLACLQFVHTQACGNKRGKERPPRRRIEVSIRDSSPILKQVGAK